MEFGFKNGLILGKRLHKIDYIEYLERSGKDMLKFFLANSDRVNYLSDQLRMASVKINLFALLNACVMSQKGFDAARRYLR